MPNKKVLITGAKGVIGTILQKGLKDYPLTLIDLPEFDLCDYSSLPKLFNGHDAVIHLARDREKDLKDELSLNNFLMVYNVYKAALEAKVPRVIMASSIHADSCNQTNLDKLLNPNSLPIPDSIYGAGKVFVESLGAHLAYHGNLEVICLRFGGVNSQDNLFLEEGCSKIWLSHRDCISLVTAALEAEKSSFNKCTIVYGVSNNSGKVHNCSNPFGWTPQDGA